MFSSKPSRFVPTTHCSSKDTHAWSNKRGYGYTTFEHALDEKTVTHPTHRLEAIHSAGQPCAYLNPASLAPAHSPGVGAVANASCARNGAVPNWCIPVADTLEQQERMFKSIRFDI
jgi:hypothetical protein